MFGMLVEMQIKHLRHNGTYKNQTKKQLFNLSENRQTAIMFQ